MLLELKSEGDWMGKEVMSALRAWCSWSCDARATGSRYKEWRPHGLERVDLYRRVVLGGSS